MTRIQRNRDEVVRLAGEATAAFEMGDLQRAQSLAEAARDLGLTVEVDDLDLDQILPSVPRSGNVMSVLSAP